MDIRPNVITIPHYRSSYNFHHPAMRLFIHPSLSICLLLFSHRRFSGVFHSWDEDRTGLHSQLGLSFCPARDVALNLSLVDAVHGQPHQSPANHQAPEAIPLSWVRIQAGGKHQVLPVITVAQFNSRLNSFRLLVKINPWSVPGDLQDGFRTADQNCAMDVDGHEARQHHTRLEHVGPDHSFHAPLSKREKHTFPADAEKWIKLLSERSRLKSPGPHQGGVNCADDPGWKQRHPDVESGRWKQKRFKLSGDFS